MSAPSIGQRAIRALIQQLAPLRAEAKARMGGRAMGEPGSVASAIARELGVGTRSIQRARRLLVQRPDLAQEVLAGSLPLKRAEKMARAGQHSASAGERIYFIECETAQIKIGRAAFPEMRLEEFQIGCPHRLRLLGSFLPEGDPAKAESGLHRRFRAWRCLGEWFAPSPELTTFIKEHTS